MYGREATMPIDVALSSDDPTLKLWNPTDYRTKLVQGLAIARQAARDCIQLAQFKQKQWYDKHHKKRVKTFHPGSRVWLRKVYVKKGEASKFAHLWHGPYKVMRRVSEKTYELKLPNKRQHNIVSVDRLKKCHSLDDKPQESELTTAAEEVNDEELTWLSEVKSDDKVAEVQAIVDKTESMDKDGAMQTLYRVRWKNHKKEEDTWEPAEDLEKVQDLVDKFEQQHSTGHSRKQSKSEPQHKPKPQPKPKANRLKRQKKT
jgi:hypothetical protein